MHHVSRGGHRYSCFLSKNRAGPVVLNRNSTTVECTVCWADLLGKPAFSCLFGIQFVLKREW